MEINCLIDCGATTSLLSEKSLKKFDPKNIFHVRPQLNVLKTVNGEAMRVVGNVDLLVPIGNECFDVSFVVCDIEADGILGQDFLRANVDSINYKRSCLMMGGDVVPLWTGGQALHICRVELQQTVEIPANSMMMVPIKIPQKEHLSELGLVEPSFHLMATKEISLMGGVVSISSDPVMTVLNYGNSSVRLYKNTNLGTCESYFEPPMQPIERVACVQEQHNEEFLPDHLVDLYERSSQHLNDQEKSEFVDLLCKYQNVFSQSSEDIGLTNLVKHRINTGDAVPIRQPPRRLPFGKRAIEKQEIETMLDRGVIEQSSSPWASPIVLVTKKDGSCRFCVDYRKLNEVTIKDAYPLPRVDDCIDALSGSRFFSSLDLNSGYWQVAMDEKDKEKTAFTTTMGLYQFTLMSFGLVNAPATFERLMENVLRGLQWVECLLYMDDIIVPSKSVHQGLERLEKIFQRLKNAGLKCKPSKYIFFQKQVKFLGHLVSEEGVATDPAKISAVRDWSTPRNVKEVKSFLGLCSYYRRFVSGFAQIARPLHKISDKGTAFHWTEECERAFQHLKTSLTTSPILGYPVHDAPFVLDTDASDFATGAVLSQLQNDKEVVIAYHSKSLNIHEQQYCVTRKELLAVLNAFNAFHHFLYGQSVLVRTDNAAVSWMRNLKQPTGQVARWLQILGTYDFTVVHRPGTQHRNADALSRAPCSRCAKQQGITETFTHENLINDDTPCGEETSPVVNTDTVRMITRSQNDPLIVFKQTSYPVQQWSLGDINSQQKLDPSLLFIIQSLERSSIRPSWQQISTQSECVKSLWRMWDRLSITDGCLMRSWFE